jgi:hypothetical protein
MTVRDCDRLTRSQRRRRFGVQPNVFERLKHRWLDAIAPSPLAPG